MSGTASTAKNNVIDIAKDIGGRRTPRRAYRRSMGVLIGGHYEVMEGRSLSEGGVSFHVRKGSDPKSGFADAEIAKGVRLAVTLILPAGTSIVLRGEIIYLENEGTGRTVGVKFDTVPLQMRREIRTYVSSKQAGESELN